MGRDTGREQHRDERVMSDIRLRNIDQFIDRHGKPRHYYRRGKGARVQLPGEPGSPEFMTAYAAAANEEVRWPAKSVPEEPDYSASNQWPER